MNRTRWIQTSLFDDNYTNKDVNNASNAESDLDDEPGWPTHRRFPYNRLKRDGGTEKVEKWVEHDLKKASDILMITGYTSLSRIIAFLSRCFREGDYKNNIRILIGSEPTSERTRQMLIGGDAVDVAIRDSLLNSQLSIYQSLDIIQTLEMLSRDHIQVRASRKSSQVVHAKIYKTENTITFGSSNYSTLGLERKIEVNKRLSRTNKKDRQEAYELSCYAEKIWQINDRDYKERLCELLKKVLQEVSWQEALARGCAELLEGGWIKQYIESVIHGDYPELLGFQTQGVAQALYIIESVGSVLIADAAGSGKTRIGAALLKSVLYKLWSDPVRLLNHNPVLLAPPRVLSAWDDMTSSFGYKPELFSHGDMSNASARKRKRLIRAIQNAQIIAIDEAHNFLNRGSQRSQLLTENIADYVILFTATPVNREPTDLLRVVMLLGPDNFSDEIINTLESALGSSRHKNQRLYLQDEQLIELQDTIRQFTVRRTKRMINDIINTEQQENEDNKETFQFRYPKHKPETYPCEGTPRDQQLATKVYVTTQQLKGVLWLRQSLRRPINWRKTDAEALDYRLAGAKGLATYMVMDRLRSSRIALLEHLHGTEEAIELLGIKSIDKPETTDGIVATLYEIVRNSLLPKNHLDTPLPDWLIDAKAYRIACEEEIEWYKQISKLTLQISTHRGQAKIEAIEKALFHAQNVLAFDRHIISLYYFRSLFDKEKCEVLVATGSTKTKSATRKLQKLLDPNEEDTEKALEHHQDSPKQLVAFCSDALSEGINLQKASGVIFLDTPTVVRRVEQRIGRVERIDSPYSHVKSYWPKDSSAFAPRANEKLFDRLLFVRRTLGPNLELPDEWNVDQVSPDSIVDPEEIMEELKNIDVELEEDAFAPIQQLVIGAKSIIDSKIYRDMRKQTARIRAATWDISSVSSKEAWAFLTVRAEKGSAPKLIFFAASESNPTTKLSEVANGLRSNLTQETQKRIFDGLAQQYLNQFMLRLSRTERTLISRKKQRALEEMEWFLYNHPQIEELMRRELHSTSEVQSDDLQGGDIALIGGLRKLFSSSYNEKDFKEMTINWNVLAERWLTFVRPTFQEYIQQPGRKKKLIRLKDIRTLLKNKHIEMSDLRTLLAGDSLWVTPLEKRVVAAIVAVPENIPNSFNLNDS